jgi:hypothetical protein
VSAPHVCFSPYAIPVTCCSILCYVGMAPLEHMGSQSLQTFSMLMNDLRYASKCFLPAHVHLLDLAVETILHHHTISSLFDPVCFMSVLVPTGVLMLRCNVSCIFVRLFS